MLIFGHRGASGYAPENTLAAFELALEQGCTALELDVQLTRDEQLVVIHDFWVDRTTNGTGLVREMELEQIRQLDAGAWYDAKFAGEKIPTLEEVLNLVPEHILLNLELKIIPRMRGNIEQLVIDLLMSKNRQHQVIISSFDHSAIQIVQEYLPEIKTGLLLYGQLLDLPKYINANELDLFSIHPAYPYLTEHTVAVLNRLKKPIYTYTVNRSEDLGWCYQYGVDGVITDYPDQAQKLLEVYR
ncbi:glycerophosphoryl diester phosphodiesterase [Caldalkalibacillus thermarum TA2.A1]|uniref:Glycerophosphodiester phosphodiesterase n=1 Tax=Caldalkalibacillus thermarum (strain TA2.A1) TaxID=986075 RepID=F5L6A2_CALTT|nr:glycerophosphodiester phosphodiesterase [Caldalkalibacillus thermarum]EGL83152.1 glycerophosphoryl diester phosphodiesterase [Caldalkalibacillus thermarum TA2.A1]QZT34848.1 glycerophosphodiester phosphodiesterase [Caldalkalibacillus thermarum TA2.A1]